MECPVIGDTSSCKGFLKAWYIGCLHFCTARKVLSVFVAPLVTKVLVGIASCTFLY